MPNKEQIYGLLRMVGAMAVAWLVGRGVITEGDASTLMTTAIDAIMAVIAAGLAAYSFWTRRDAGKVLAADTVKGVEIEVNRKAASPSVIAAAAKPDNAIKLVSNGPVTPKEKTA